MVGLGGSLKVIEPWHGCVGKVLKDNRARGWTLQTTEPWKGWVGKALIIKSLLVQLLSSHYQLHLGTEGRSEVPWCLPRLSPPPALSLAP